MFPKALLNALLLAVNPAFAVVTIPLTRHVNTLSALNILQLDQARTRYLATGVSDCVKPEPVINQAQYYSANVGVGSPPTTYSLLVDTGSSNTWVGANKTFVKTVSTIKTNQHVHVRYGSGNFTGIEYLDTVTLGELVIHNQSIGVATSANGFGPVDGILGVGPVDLTVGTLSPDNKTAIPTVTNNAFSQGLIGAEEIGISFEPTTVNSIQNGEITWGGVDKTKFTGSLHYAPITSSSRANRYWGVNQTITYGSMTIMNTSEGIIDTGTTLILLPTPSYKLYEKATGATFNSTIGLLKISPDQYDALQPLHFNINGKIFTLTANAQIWPRSLNVQISGQPDDIFLVVQDFGPFGAAKFDFVNGYTWLERFYTVYDTANHRVGFATTPFTYATTN